MNKTARESIKHIILGAVFAGAAGFIFAPSGMVGNAINIDLSYLMLPVIGFILIRTVRRLTILFLPGLGGNLLGALLSGASVAVLVFGILSWLSAIQNVSADISAALDAQTMYAILFIAGVTVSMLSSTLDEHEKDKIFSPALAIVAKLMIGFSFFGALGYFDIYSEVYKDIGTALLAGFIASSVSSLAIYGHRIPNRYVSAFSKVISSSAWGLFFLGGLLYSYIAFIRPALADSFQYTPLIEWGLVCVGAFWFYRRIRLSVQEIAVPEKSIPVMKHAQQIDELVDKQIQKLGAIQQNFVENGHRQELLVTLISLLVENRWERERIVRTMTPLIDYEKPGVPWYASIWSQSSLEKSAKEKRNTILRDIINKITIQETPTQTVSEVEYEPE